MQEYCYQMLGLFAYPPGTVHRAGGICKQPQAGTKVEQNPLELCEILSFGANQLH